MLRFFRSSTLSSKKRAEMLAKETSQKFQELLRASEQISMQKKIAEPAKAALLESLEIFPTSESAEKSRALEKMRTEILPEFSKLLLQLYSNNQPLPKDISQEELIKIFDTEASTLKLCINPQIMERLKNAAGEKFKDRVLTEPKFELEKKEFMTYWNKSKPDYDLDTRLRVLYVTIKKFDDYMDKIVGTEKTDYLNSARLQALNEVINLKNFGDSISKFQIERKNLNANVNQQNKDIHEKAKNNVISKIDEHIAKIESALTGKINPILLKDLNAKEARERKKELRQAYSILHSHHFFSGKAIRGEKTSMITYLEELKRDLMAVKSQFDISDRLEKSAKP